MALHDLGLAEEQFYLLWPFVLKYAPRALSLALPPALILAAAVVELGFVTVSPAAASVWGRLATPIAYGVVLAQLLHTGAGYRWLAAVVGRRWSAPLALALAVGVLAVPACPRSAFALAFTALVACCVVREDHGLAGPLTWRPMVHIGAVSYGIYLMHVLARNAVARALAAVGVGGALPVFLVTTAVTVLIATISFRTFERRFLALKVRFAPGPRIAPGTPRATPTPATRSPPASPL